MTNFFDYINDPVVQEDLKEFLKPTNDILAGIKSFTKDTPLEDIVATVSEEEDALILRYYLTETLNTDLMMEIEDRQELLQEIDIPLKIVVEIYEPHDEPSIVLRSYIDE